MTELWLNAMPRRERLGLVVLGWLAGACASSTPADNAEPAAHRETARVSSSGTPASSASPSANSTSSVAATSANSTSPVAASSSATASSPSPLCPNDMQAVSGQYCTRLKQKCLKKRRRRQCAEFAPGSQCSGQEVPLTFCMDRYEWPNQKGALPKVMNTWKDAKKSCEDIGKRLCTEDEWTLACEGPERRGFPYGDVRDATACPFDKKSPRVNERRLFYSHTQAAELARLDQRDPSGSYERCVSPFGVHDMTGSVDEWVHYPPGRPYRSSLKGGNWGEYRNACRPVTRGHGENWPYYQTGFRCCKAQEPAALKADAQNQNAQH